MAPAWAAQPVLAASLCAVAATALFVVMGTLLSGNVAGAVAAGTLCGIALALAIALGWVEALGPLVASLSLPALYADDDVRVSAPLVVAMLVVAGWALGRGLDRRPLAPHAASARSFGWLVAAVLATALFAEARVAAARESVNFLVLLGVFLFAMDRVGEAPRRALSLVRWATVAAALAGVAAGLETVGVLPGRFPLPGGSGYYRATGGFGWPNELGMFFAISLPLAIAALRTAGGPLGRAACLAAIAAIAAGLATTFSRGSWLATGAAPVMLLLAGERRIAFRFWGAALFGALFVELASGGLITDRIEGTTGDVSVAQRLLLTGAGLLMFQSSPLLGVGPGGFPDALEEFGPRISGLFDFVGSAHNGYVHMAAETGVLGLVALVGFVVSTLIVLVRGARAAVADPGVSHDERAVRTALAWSFTVACIVTLFEWPFGHGVGELIVLVAATGRVLSLPRASTGGARP